jgi:GNAT superfamily N-acetyltransferase
MNETSRIRDYLPSDYSGCEALVEEAWAFSRLFPAPELGRWALRLYTRGPVLGSNYRKVVEIDGEVVGFLFGWNAARKPSSGLLERVAANVAFLAGLACLRRTPIRLKRELLGKLMRHEAARDRIEKRGCSEVHLFVIGAAHRKLGLGRRLLRDFEEDCRSVGAGRLIVEVNLAQAAEFYERCGYGQVGAFESPLHGLASTPGAAIYAKAL